jgi:hypothetical protein
MIFERNELILEQEKILEQKNHGPSLQSPKRKSNLLHLLHRRRPPPHSFSLEIITNLSGHTPSPPPDSLLDAHNPLTSFFVAKTTTAVVSVFDIEKVKLKFCPKTCKR